MNSKHNARLNLSSTQRLHPLHMHRPSKCLHLASSNNGTIKVTYSDRPVPVDTQENGKGAPSNLDPPTTPTTQPTSVSVASASYLSNLSPTALPAATVDAPDYLPPPQNYLNLVNIGMVKGKKPAGRIFLLGCQAGALLSFACILMATVGSNIPEILASNPGLHKLICGLIFPCGLMMVTLNGTELYTGNSATVTMAVLEKKLAVREVRGV